MILDTIGNSSKYEILHRNFKKGFDFIRNSDLENLEPGRYEIDSDEVFVLVQTYKTSPENEKKFETHRNYIDIQYIVSGTEVIGYTPAEKLTVCDPYNEECDAEMSDCPDMTPCTLEAGSFILLFPEDPHKPGCSYGNNHNNVRKIVVKVKL